jgi:ABC-2 type transport system ATP-binding protein
VTTNAIYTENLLKRFRKMEALRGLNLSVPEGAVYALVGANGAGKTTAIKILINILPPTGGRVEVLGMDSTRIHGKQFESIGYVSENQELPDWMRVDAFFSFLRPFYPSWDRKLEVDLIGRFDLPLDRRLRNLSRGMRMKAALASALAFHPKLIVLDEPFTGLDPLVRDQLIQSLLERAEESTVFISSHDLAEIESFSSHVGYLENGQLRFSEELTTLTDRFREVELTFDAPRQLPSKTPDTWMHVNTSAAVVRFIDSSFVPEKTNAEVREVFGETRNVTFSAMSLRAIFLAMARNGSTRTIKGDEQ